MERRSWENKTKQLINVLNSTEEGRIISYSVIEQLLGISQYEPEFNYIVSRARAEIIKNSVITKAIMYEGIKVLKSNEIAEYIYEKYLVSSLRKQETAIEILKYIDESKLKKEDVENLKSLGKLLQKINNNSVEEVIKSQLQLNKAKTTISIGGN